LRVFISFISFIDYTIDFKGLYKIKWDPFLTRIVYTILDSVLIQLKLNWVLINRCWLNHGQYQCLFIIPLCSV